MHVCMYLYVFLYYRLGIIKTECSMINFINILFYDDVFIIICIHNLSAHFINNFYILNVNSALKSVFYI